MSDENESYKFSYEGLTFDDVLLIPGESGIEPREVDIRTRLVDGIELNIPIMTSAMDTVTEAQMAIAIAREGGIGTIHKNMTVSQQADQVNRVKRFKNGIIGNPIFVCPDSTVEEVKDVMSEYQISGVPVCSNGKLVGILTKRDLRFTKNTSSKQKISEIMTSKNLVTAPQGTTIEKARQILGLNRLEKLPIIDSQGNLKGLITIKDIEGLVKYSNSAQDSSGRLLCAAAVGATKDVLERAEALIASDVDALILDSAHGHSINVLNTVKKIRENFPHIKIIAGNIATAEAAEALINAGSNGVKIGIGPGSICTTRIVAGVGVPQLTAIYKASRIAKKHGVTVIADGGIKYSGDIVKAIAAGADSVMIGSLVAGCDESPGKDEVYKGRRFKSYRGMGSLAAMGRGSKDRYFQEGSGKFVPEGVEGRVAYKGCLSDIIYQLIGGLKSGMGYTGCRNIEDVQVKTRFVKITGAGLKESHTHDVGITKEAPNY